MSDDTKGAAMLAPLVHLNGSSADTLIEQYERSMGALRKALDAMREGYPNARDYYPQGDDAFRLAREQYDARIRAVDNVLAELGLLAENVYEQKTERKKNRP